MIRLPRLPAPVLRGAGTLTATAILVFALLIAITGALRTRQEINASFAEQMQIERGQLTLEKLLKLQLDEENYIRAYVITRDRNYIASYFGLRPQFTREDALLHHILAAEHLRQAQGALYDYESAHLDWRARVAKPMLQNPRTAGVQLDKIGKYLTDQQTLAAGYIENLLAHKNASVLQATQAQVDSTLYWRAVWLVLFGLLAILFNAYRSRVMRELDEERLTTQTLQRAFRSEHAPLDNCRIGSAYAAASSKLAVGGDVFDVHRLSDRLGLLLIADVSGKGIDAAVLTAFIKFTIRGIALRRRDPGFILQEFNRAFPQTVENPYLFVTMFVGIIDTVTLRLNYASAGHDSAFLRRASAVEQLAVTGPVLGVMEEPFDVRTVTLRDGDTIVLATDGLTEARDQRGAFLGAEGAAQWIAECNDDPGLLAAEIVERVRQRSANALRDDVAVLAVRITHPKVTFADGDTQAPAEQRTAGEAVADL